MKKWLEKQFQLSSYGTNVKTELLAGLTTFVTMAYVLATVPSLLGNAGLDRNVMFTAMILLIILTTCAMAFYTNRPFALAPGLVPGGMILAILITTVIGIPFGVTELPSSPFSLPAGIGSQFMNIDFIGALDFAYIPFLIALFIPDFFSTFGTVLGVGAKAGYLDEDGNLPGIDKCFKVDAIATSFGALFGMPSMTTYLESSAATGPILIFIGINMLSSMSKIHYEDLTEAVPAFICIAFTIFANNIANGICAAIPAYFIMKIAAGKVKELSPVMYIMVAVCLLYFYTLI